MAFRELTLIEKLESCIEIIEEDCVDNYREFMITTLQESIIKITPRKKIIHSCDIAGCASCGNPEEYDYEN